MTGARIAGAARTAIGAPGGGLAGLRASELGAAAVRLALERAGVEPGAVDHVVLAAGLPADPEDVALARVVARQAGIPASVPAVGVAAADAGGAEAIAWAALLVQTGRARVVVAGGAQSVSRVPYWLAGLRPVSGVRPGSGPRPGARAEGSELADPLVAGTADPFGGGPLGLLAEGGASREDQDRFAARSHERALAARRAGAEPALAVAAAREVEPVRAPAAGADAPIDELVRADLSIERLATLKPVFLHAGTVTAGNSARPADGAAAVVVVADEAAPAAGMRILATAATGDAGDGTQAAALAARAALEQAGATAADVTAAEIHEGTAAGALAVAGALGLRPDAVNPLGGAIALGHPIAATGAVMAVRLCAELQRSPGGLGLIALPAAGGGARAIVLGLAR